MSHSAILVLLILLAIIGAPIFAVMTGLAALGATTIREGQSLTQAFAGELTRVFSGLATGAAATTLSTIPLFTFAGYVMAEARTAERMVSFAKALVGWFPGGLALVTIVACALFTTFTGASGVTIVAIGALLLPSLLKEHYREKFSLGLVTGTGSIGLLFPPALPLIVYGIVYGMSAQQAVDTGEGAAIELVDFSITKFLMAGIVPGLVLVGLMGSYAVYVAVRDKVPRDPFEGVKALKLAFRALPEILIPVLILGTLVTGWLQIPEAASVTALYVLIIEALLYRDVRLRDLPRIARNAMALVGAIFVIILAATALTDYFINANVPTKLYEWLDRYIDSRWSFLLALNILLLIVGCLMDIFSAIMVVVPLIAPAAMRYGVDPYHLGVIFLLNLEIGYLTPPVGLNLFITSFRFRKPMMHVYASTLPFLGVMLVALALVTYIPGLTLVKAKRGGVAEAAAAETGGADAGVNVTWPDGGVWTPDRCETPEMKEDPLTQAECRGLFAVWARCQKLEDPLDKLECEQKAIDGEDPFAIDAGDDEALDAGAAPTADGAAAAP